MRGQVFLSLEEREGGPAQEWGEAPGEGALRSPGAPGLGEPGRPSSFWWVTSCKGEAGLKTPGLSDSLKSGL